jgi:pimeloyl-ACP methyl ester carboxylesterase
VLPVLGRRYELHLVDLPRAAALARRHGTDAAGWLADWLDAARLERASLLGHSLGGLAAARLAARSPERVDRLVLAAPVGVPAGRRLAGYAVPLAVSLAHARPFFLPTLARDALRTGPASLVRGVLEATRADVAPESSPRSARRRSSCGASATRSCPRERPRPGAPA